MQFLLWNSVPIFYVIAVKIEQADVVCSFCCGILPQYCVIIVQIEQADQVCSFCSGILSQYCVSLC